MKKKLTLLLCLVAALFLVGCGTKQEETKIISTIDDLEGATIGVQLGTIGDIYASDYEGDDAGTTIVRYNKITDAVQ
nr:amino acid ABC transporter permease [Pseudobutyrivibrio sp.]